MSCPCCPTDVTVAVGTNAASKVHSVNFKLTAVETEAGAFGDGEYGNILACRKNGTINISAYCPLTDTDLGDTGLSVVIVFCDTTITASDTTLVDVSGSADFNGNTPPTWDYSFRINQDVTISG